MPSMWCDLDVLGQKSRSLLYKQLSRLLAISGQELWKTEQKPSALYNRNIFLLYMCCTAIFK
jgi:hypothetical protein